MDFETSKGRPLHDVSKEESPSSVVDGHQASNQPFLTIDNTHSGQTSPEFRSSVKLFACGTPICRRDAASPEIVLWQNTRCGEKLCWLDVGLDRSPLTSGKRGVLSANRSAVLKC